MEQNIKGRNELLQSSVEQKIRESNDVPFFSTYSYIATGQDGGLGSHLLVDAVLQASQVEVGISRKETENNGRLNGTVRETV
jgi:hypothetical protein